MEQSPFIEEKENDELKKSMFSKFMNPKRFIFLSCSAIVIIGIVFFIIAKIKNDKIGIIPLDFYWIKDATDINNVTRAIESKKYRKPGIKNIKKDRYKINIINSYYNSKKNLLVINNDKIIQLPKDPNRVISIIREYRQDLYSKTSIF